MGDFLPVIGRVDNTAKDSLADDQLPKEFSRLPGIRLVLPPLRKLVVRSPVNSSGKEPLGLQQKYQPGKSWRIDVGQGQSPLRRGPTLGGASDHHGAAIQHLENSKLISFQSWYNTVPA